MEPYVPSDEPLLESEEKKKKKKKKSKDKDNKDVEMTTTATKSKPKSEKKLKSSSKKPKSEKKPKSSRKKSKKTAAAAVATAVVLPPQKSVAAESGFEPLIAKEINVKSVPGEDGSGFRYAITGDESQIVTISIPPGEVCRGEPGSMLYLTDRVTMTASCDGGACRRCIGGESCCLLTFANNDNDSHTNEPGFAGLTTNLPLAKVVPVHLDDPSVNGSLIVQGGSYMASYGDVHLTFSCDFNIGRCLCGGMVRTETVS